MSRVSQPHVFSRAPTASTDASPKALQSLALNHRRPERLKNPAHNPVFTVFLPTINVSAFSHFSFNKCFEIKIFFLYLETAYMSDV